MSSGCKRRCARMSVLTCLPLRGQPRLPELAIRPCSRFTRFKRAPSETKRHQGAARVYQPLGETQRDLEQLVRHELDQRFAAALGDAYLGTYSIDFGNGLLGQHLGRRALCHQFSCLEQV